MHSATMHTFTVQNDVLFELKTFDEGLACGWKDATRGTGQM